MRASAERVSGMQLDWFFDEWVHRTGLVDYRLRDGKSEQVGAYRHPMPVVSRRARPRGAQLDPQHLTPDWDARNNGEPGTTKFVFGWPFLEQWDRYRNVAAIEPQVWYTGPGGLTARRARAHELSASRGRVGRRPRDGGARSRAVVAARSCRAGSPSRIRGFPAPSVR